MVFTMDCSWFLSALLIVNEYPFLVKMQTMVCHKGSSFGSWGELLKSLKAFVMVVVTALGPGKLKVSVRILVL